MPEDSTVSVSTLAPIQWHNVLANLLLRFWIGLRLVGAGLDKFRSGDSWPNVSFNLENYKTKVGAIAKLTADHGFLPQKLCDAYAQPLGYILIAAGVWAVLGLFLELGLFFAGLVVLSLGVGLATLPDDTEVVYIGIHVLIIAVALMTCRHKSLSLDGLLFRRKVD